VSAAAEERSVSELLVEKKDHVAPLTLQKREPKFEGR